MKASASINTHASTVVYKNCSLYSGSTMLFSSAPPPPPAPATLPHQDISQTLLQTQNTLGINVSTMQAVNSNTEQNGKEKEDNVMSD